MLHRSHAIAVGISIRQMIAVSGLQNIACKSKLLPAKGQFCPQQKAITSAVSCLTHIVREEEDDYSVYHVTGTPVNPFLVTVSIINTSVEMEVDTGASVSIISEATYNHLWSPEDAPLSRNPVSNIQHTVVNR